MKLNPRLSRTTAKALACGASLMLLAALRLAAAYAVGSAYRLSQGLRQEPIMLGFACF
ncbi:MAG: hypothetical protein ACLQU2_00740 [Candidatus Binataceae bacterium]